MLNSSFKIAAFLLLIASCTLVVKMVARKGDVDCRIETTSLSVSSDTAFIFIGSSRVRKSIDPQIIKSHFDKFNVVNLGIQGGNFLSSSVMADIVVQQNNGHKVLFIELALLRDELPDGVFNFSSLTGSSPASSVIELTEGQSFAAQSMLMSNIVNHQLFKTVTLRDEVRQIIGYKLDNDPEIGFLPYENNDWHDTNSFLMWEEINTSCANAIDLTKYMAIVNYLERLAKSNDSQIVFFLPVTYTSQVERDIVTALYRRLPGTMKLEYTENFLNEITRAEYLGDQNHLNKQGADTYSRLLPPTMESVVRKHNNAR
jgi:hypothetical protein